MFIENERNGLLFIGQFKWERMTNEYLCNQLVKEMAFVSYVLYSFLNRFSRMTLLALVFVWRLCSFRWEFCAAWPWSNAAVPTAGPPLANAKTEGLAWQALVFTWLLSQRTYNAGLCLAVRKKGLHGKEISCNYFYEDIIVQFLVNPTQNYHLHTGKPARKNFSSNFFVHHPLSPRLWGSSWYQSEKSLGDNLGWWGPSILIPNLIYMS